MDEEPLQAKVFDEERERSGRRMSLGPIIGIVILIILLSMIGVYVFYDPGVDSVDIINPSDFDSDGDGTYDSVEFTVVATSVGPWRVNGEGTLRIELGGDETYYGKFEIKNDRKSFSVPYDQFVMENGVYNLIFEMGEASTTSNFEVYFVPTDINLTVKEEYRSYRARVSPYFSGTRGPTVFTNYNSAYQLEFNIQGPEGYSKQESRSMADYNPVSSLITTEIASDYQGMHDISVKFTNNLVKTESMYRTIIPPEVSTFLNRAPTIDDITYPSTVRAGEEATFTIIASDPDENGEVEQIYIIWDQEDPEGGANTTVDVTGTTTMVSHTFPEAGTYSVYITVMDNGPFYGIDQDYRKANDTVEDVTVRASLFG